jgi:poly(A) polymerase
MSLPEYLPEEFAGFLRHTGLRTVFDSLESAGGEVRVNGGAVRNALLGEKVVDVDLSTTLLPGHVIECLQHSGIKTIPTGIEHGTVTAIADGRAFEITTLREDIETDGRRAVVSFGTDWRADAMRRDFTMNALYCDRTRRLYDPLQGYGDLAARIVRFIGDPENRIAEDRLRILRFFRFFAWYGSDRPNAEGLKACAKLRCGLLDLSAERVWREVKKLLEAPDPTRALLWMRTTKILSLVLPETDKWGIDLMGSLVASCSDAGEAADPLLRLMASIPPTVAATDTLASRMKLSRSEADRLREWALLNEHSVPLNAAEEERKSLARSIFRLGRQPVLDQLRLMRARAWQKSRAEEVRQLRDAVEFCASWHNPQFPVSGQDLLDLGFQPGLQLGRLLGRLKEHWIQSDFTATRTQLLALARDSVPDSSG